VQSSNFPTKGTSRSPRTLRDGDEYSLLQKVRWSRFAKSVVYTIITNAGPPNTIHRTLASDRVPEITPEDGNARLRYDAGRFGLRPLVTEPIECDGCVHGAFSGFL